MKSSIYYDLSNAEYHASEGISNSGLGLIDESPATYIWHRNAPVDEDKLNSLDLGSALHCLLLEPDTYEQRYMVAPEVNRRTTKGREEEAEFMAGAKELGRQVLTFEDHHKLNIMRDSVMAHPNAKWLLEADGHAEASIYWTDKETGERCRIRPDRFLNGRPIIIDVKKVEGMDRFQRQCLEFGYHRQSAMYSDGFKQHFGEEPSFLFLAVSSTINCGRYPVRVRPLSDHFFNMGHELYRHNLETYHRCRVDNEWHDLEPIEAPYWAR